MLILYIFSKQKSSMHDSNWILFTSIKFYASILKLILDFDFLENKYVDNVNFFYEIGRKAYDWLVRSSNSYSSCCFWYSIVNALMFLLACDSHEHSQRKVDDGSYTKANTLLESIVEELRTERLSSNPEAFAR